MKMTAKAYVTAAIALALGFCGCSEPQAVASNGGVVSFIKTSSILGKFHASLPCFAEQGKFDGDAQGGITHGNTLGCNSLDGTRYFAMRPVYKEGLAGASHYFELAKKGMWPNSKFVIATDGQSVDAHVREGAKCAWSRTMRAESDLLILIVEANGEVCDNPDNQDAKRFFDSVKLS